MAENGNVLTLTDSNFNEQVLQSDQPVLVDFWATWCGPCRAIAPTIEQLARDFEGKAKIGKVDVDNNPQTAMQYNIRSIPTLLIFEDGSVADQIVGVASKKQLTEKLNSVVTNGA